MAKISRPTFRQPAGPTPGKQPIVFYDPIKPVPGQKYVTPQVGYTISPYQGPAYNEVPPNFGAIIPQRGPGKRVN